MQFVTFTGAKKARKLVGKICPLDWNMFIISAKTPAFSISSMKQLARLKRVSRQI
jgi:hypothetical protein